MGIYGEGMTITFEVWDAANEVGKAGLTPATDLAITLVRDGVAAAATGAITEVGGWFYKLAVSAAEQEAYDVMLHGTCTAADCHVIPRPWQNYDGSAVLEALWADHDTDEGSLAWAIGTLLRRAIGPVRVTSDEQQIFEDAIDGTTRSASDISTSDGTSEMTPA